MTLLQSWFWPDVSSRKNAFAAINETFWVTLFLGALTAVFTFIDIARDWQADERLLGFFNAALVSGIAFGHWLGLRCMCSDALRFGSGLGIPAAWSFFGLVSLTLWHGVRGTFAFHRFGPITAGTPSIEDSFHSFGQSQQPTRHESERK